MGVNKIIVVVRNVTDTIASLRHVQDEGKHTPGLVRHPYWDTLTVTEKHVWLAQNIAPWQFAFYVSWLKSPLRILFVRYEDYYADQAKGLANIAGFLGCPPMTPSGENNSGGNHKVGKSGAGKELDPKVWAMLYRQCEAWSIREMHEALLEYGK
jgi:hypothetical protein